MHPSFTFLDEEGNELNKIIGVFTPEEFIAQAKNALDPQSTFNYLKQRYNSGERDADFLLDYCYRLNDANEIKSQILSNPSCFCIRVR